MDAMGKLMEIIMGQYSKASHYFNNSLIIVPL